MQTVKHESRTYEVIKKVGEGPQFTIYLCRETGTDRDLILQVAREVADNGLLDRNAFILNRLAERAQEIEEEDAAKPEPERKGPFNYHFGFPEVKASFTCAEQGGRRINILAFRNITDAKDVIPLTKLTEKHKLRVDIKTSAWMMGKLLKLLAFAHELGFAIDSLGGDNILIDSNQHYVILFDWSESQIHTGEIPARTRRTEISTAASSIITVLGGDLETGQIPDDGTKDFAAYTDFLWRLSRGDESSALKGHGDFYDLIRTQLGWKGFHPFTIHNLDQ